MRRESWIERAGLPKSSLVVVYGDPSLHLSLLSLQLALGIRGKDSKGLYAASGRSSPPGYVAKLLERAGPSKGTRLVTLRSLEEQFLLVNLLEGLVEELRLDWVVLDGVLANYLSARGYAEDLSLASAMLEQMIELGRLVKSKGILAIVTSFESKRTGRPMLWKLLACTADAFLRFREERGELKCTKYGKDFEILGEWIAEEV